MPEYNAGQAWVRDLSGNLVRAATLEEEEARPGGGASDLETVLAEGNTTNENAIVMPLMTINGTTDAGPSIYAIDEGGMSGGNLNLRAGAPGNAALSGGSQTGSNPAAHLYLGSGGNDVHNGATIELRGASATADGLIFLNLPTADPGVVGALWADNSVVKVSAG